MIVTPPIKGFALSILSLLILTLSAACGGAGNQDFASAGSARTDPETTLILAYDGWTGTYLSAYVLKAIFEDELGYQAKVAKQQDIPAAFESVSSGRTDIFTSAWFPARDSTLDKHPNLVRLGVVYGGKNKDAFEGWMVSGGLAREYRLTHVRDLNDRQLAIALDSDGDGRGNLIGCPSSWVCAGRHPQILQDFGLAGLYEVDIPADEKELVSLVEGRLRGGKPALFYWYQPSFFPGDIPITDRAVWLEGTSPYLPLAFNRTVVRSDLVANYPDAAKVLSEFEISGQDIGWAIGRIQDEGESDKFLEELARTWITEHRAEVDRWLQGVRGRTPTKSLPSETLTVAYSPEKEDLFLELVIDFNLSLPPDIPPIRPVRVSMEEMLSGSVQKKFGAISPDSSVWLDQLDRMWQESGGGSTTLVGARSRYALSPIVIAMWQDTAAEMGYPSEPLGWEDLIQKVSRDPRFRWSHSSAATASGLLTTTAEFYAGAGKLEDLTQEDLESEETKDFVANVESTVTQYGGESEDRVVVRLLAEGGRPLNAFVAQEQWVIFYNRNSDSQKLVAIYPKEGTFWMDHPLVLLDGPWVSEAQKGTFRRLSAFVTGPEQQQVVLQAGYRSADPSITPGSGGSLIRAEYGADPAEPKKLLKVPATGVLESIREAWRLLKKPANIYLVVDVSGSMKGDKIRGAKAALLSFIEQVEGDQDRVALVPFSSNHREAVDLGPPDRAELEKAIVALHASGGTQLYDAVAFAYDRLQSQADNDRINVILVMTDGQSEGSISVVESRLGKETFPVLIFTVGYGEDADFSVLQRIARLGEGRAYPSDLDTIGTLYELLSAYF